MWPFSAHTYKGYDIPLSPILEGRKVFAMFQWSEAGVLDRTGSHRQHTFTQDITPYSRASHYHPGSAPEAVALTGELPGP